MTREFFKKTILCVNFIFGIVVLSGQELYVFSEPASNMPARSLSTKYTVRMQEGQNSGRFEQRHTPELMFGASKKWMIHIASSFSDMHSSNFRWESARLYGKYRFYSNDEVHKHLRMAGFGELSYARNDMGYDELNVEGDNSGMQAGIIVTQLWNKTAFSTTIGMSRIFNENLALNYKGDGGYSAFHYSLSTGYLLFPFSYTDYRQTNLNIYAELLGQKNLESSLYFVDVAPAIQLIFNSNAKLNIGYRFQLNSNMNRMSQNSGLISFERTFLNSLQRRKMAAGSR